MRRSTGLQSWSRRSRRTMVSVRYGSASTRESLWRPWSSIATTSILCSSRWSLRACSARECVWCPPAHRVRVRAGHSGGTTPQREQDGVSELEELLGFALEALDEVEAIVGRGHSEFAVSSDRQRTLAFCWIAVGSTLKDYTRVAKLPAQQEPLSSPIRFRDRIAHQSLSQLDADVLWRVSTERVSGPARRSRRSAPSCRRHGIGSSRARPSSSSG